MTIVLDIRICTNATLIGQLFQFSDIWLGRRFSTSIHQWTGIFDLWYIKGRFSTRPCSILNAMKYLSIIMLYIINMTKCKIYLCVYFELNDHNFHPEGTYKWRVCLTNSSTTIHNFMIAPLISSNLPNIRFPTPSPLLPPPTLTLS
jgi:hypothetical protein